MQLFNNEERYGYIVKFLHWLIALLFMAQFFLVYRREYFPDSAPEKMQYILLHKSFGVTILILAVVMLISRHIGKRPLFPSHMSRIQILSAKIAHILLYLSMLIMPLSGISMSQLAGYKVSFFNLCDVPTLFLENKALASVFSQIHTFTSYTIILLVTGHTLAALYHHFIMKDNVLKRMTCDKL